MKLELMLDLMLDLKLELGADAGAEAQIDAGAGARTVYIYLQSETVSEAVALVGSCMVPTAAVQYGIIFHT